MKCFSKLIFAKVIMLALALAGVLLGSCLSAQAALGLAREAYGVWDRGGYHSVATYPYTLGQCYVDGWDVVETSRTNFNWSALDAQLGFAYTNNQMFTVQIEPAGGPGTGKTAVALHRAAYLLYTNRQRLEDAGVLVVGPNRTFLRYIEQVLPSLGESGVELVTIDALVARSRALASEPAEVERLKARAASGGPSVSPFLKKLLGRAEGGTPPAPPPPAGGTSP